MDTVIVSNGQFYSHYPKNIAKGTVDAEAVLIRLDSEWDNLTVRIHWLNVTSKVEKKPLLERDQPNTIPWEVLADLGELLTGLVVNCWLGWGIWDYSQMPGNLWGQICPQFSAAWSPLILLAIILDDTIRWKCFGEEQPVYRVGRWHYEIGGAAYSQ